MPLDLAGAIASELGEGKQARKQEEASDNAGQEGFVNLAAAITAELGTERGLPKAGARAGERPAAGDAPRAAAAAEPTAAAEAEPPPPEKERPAEAGPSSADPAAAASRGSRFANFAQSGGASAAGITVPEQPVLELPFNVGDTVEVFGLKSQFGEQLNGQIGTITKWVERKGRFMVRFGAGESDVNLRPENLREPGTGSDAEEGGATASSTAAPPASAQPSRGPPAPSSGNDSHGSAPPQAAEASAPAGGGATPGGATPFMPPERRNADERSGGDGGRSSDSPTQEPSTPSQQPKAAEADCAKAPATEDRGAPGKDDAPSPSGTVHLDSTGEAIREGDSVMLHGLSSADGQRLNGQKGVLQQFLVEKARFEVRLESGEMANVKPGNLQRLAADAGQAEASGAAADAPSADAQAPAATVGEKEGASSADPVLKVGDAVEVFGLESDSGKKLNGKRGALKEFDEAKGRFQVDLEGGSTVSLKPANLRKAEAPEEEPCDASFALGDAVQVFGLTSEAGKKLNGQRGLVAKYESKTKRFELRCQSGSTVSVKPANLQLVRSASAGEEHPNAAAADEGPELPLGRGDVVTVTGLQSESGKALNGQVGLVGASDTDGGRVEILFATANPAKLKPENIRRLDRRPVDDSGASEAAVKGEAAAQAPPTQLSSGDYIEVLGLTSEKGQAMNGQRGIVRAWCGEKQRFEVGLASGALVHLKPENVQRLEEGDDQGDVEAPDPEDYDGPLDELMSLSDEEKLASIQAQLQEAISTSAFQAQLVELRARAKNMRQYGKELEGLLRPVRDPVYRRHGINREWHLRTVEESSEASQAREEQLMDLCAFTPPERSEEQPSAARGSTDPGP